MRRKDKEITDSAVIENILKEAEIIHIAMVDDGEPYLVAMNFAYTEGVFYMHSATEGRKIDILKKNNKIAFQVSIDVAIILKEQSHECTTRYQSVYGTGRAILVDNLQEKVKALNAIMQKHSGQGENQYPPHVLDKTLTIRVEIDSMTGKKSGY